jgi:hypothetical protein
MRRMLLRLGISIENTTRFKRAPQGWIFRAPTPWIFGPRPHYLVSDAQKVKIETVLGLSLLVTCLLLAVSVLILMPPSVLLTSLPNFETRLLVFAVFWLVVSGLQNLGHCFAFQVILKNSPRASEKIRLDERLKGLAGMYSPEQLKFLLVLFLVLFVGSFFLLAYQLSKGNAGDLFLSIGGIVASGWAVILFGALLRVKLRSSRRI